jgi:hypothetical protein
MTQTTHRKTRQVVQVARAKKQEEVALAMISLKAVKRQAEDLGLGRRPAAKKPTKK